MIGIKTGWTPAAGECLLFEATRGKRTLIGVVLDSAATKTGVTFTDAVKMLNWGFGLRLAVTILPPPAGIRRSNPAGHSAGWPNLGAMTAPTAIPRPEASGRPAAGTGPSVLVVEDDEGIATQLVRGLIRGGYQVDHVTTGAAALAHSLADVVLLDLALPDGDGVRVCRKLRERSPVAIIVVTAYGEES